MTRRKARLPAGPVLTAEAMAELDRQMIEELGMPAAVLMENAARGVVQSLRRRWPTARVSVVAGPGNNGADGLATARLLASDEGPVRVLLARPGGRLAGEVARQLAVVLALGIETEEWDVAEEDEPAEIAAGFSQWLVDGNRAGAAPEVLVDALFGNGLDRPLQGPWAALVEAMNEASVVRLSVDLPSGLAGSAQAPDGPVVQADVTVAFAALRHAHVLPPAESACGEVDLVGLGLPLRVAETAGEELVLLGAHQIADWLPRRASQDHKGTRGHLLVIAGGAGTSGAAVLAVRGALRSGAGLVTAAVPESASLVLELASPESMTLACSEEQGFLCGAALDSLLDAATRRAAVVLGPGLGSRACVRSLAREFVLRSRAPLVLDADGLNAFEGEAALLAERTPESMVLLPHPGELGRLLGASNHEVQADRLRFAVWAARETGQVVVLKGHRTLIARPDGRVAINPTGNPGMATGGSGDALAGIVGALLAQGQRPFEAACCGAFVHGLAGDLAAVVQGEASLLPGDLIESLPAAFLELEALGLE